MPSTKQPSALVRLSLALFVLTAVSACGTVRIKNQEWCGDFGPQGATCFNTLNSRTRNIAKPEWDQERRDMVCTNAQNFAETKAAVEKLCKKTRVCSYEDEQVLASFFKRMDQLDNKQKKVRHAER